MKKTGSTKRQAASRPKKAASKKNVTGKGGGAGKAKAASATSQARASVQRGAGATAPVVYQTLRDRVAAADANIGETVSLSDFLKSNGWS